MLIAPNDLIAYKADVYRIVESQEEAASLTVVDSIDEQSVLEQALDDAKPTYRNNTHQRHYLISTPFRYPPLKHGSRFGTRQMPSFFYASEDLTTCLKEAAFYRFVFIKDKVTPFSKPLRTEHHVFSVSAKSQRCADLTKIEVPEIQIQLQDPLDYRYTQNVGHALREIGSEIIRYYSARHRGGVNVAITEPSAIISTVPQNMKPIRCETDGDNETVTFISPREFPVTISMTEFIVDGHFPKPA
jgi:hypothetical protein